MKAYKWWYADNPMFGGISARDMIDIGREVKLLKMVKTAIKDGEYNEHY